MRYCPWTWPPCSSSPAISSIACLFTAMICAWFGRFPIGMGAALPLTTNAYYEGLVEGNSEYLIGMFDFLQVGFFPSICLTVHTIAAWLLIP